MGGIFQTIRALLSYEDQVRRFPGRRAMRATLGGTRRYKTRTYGKEVRRDQENARRRRQIAKGMLKLEER